MNTALGVINQNSSNDKNDYLFRISLNALILNEKGEVLVVKEAGRDYWDIPGGGLDHGETIKEGLARELREEVNLTGDFSYEVISFTDPRMLNRAAIWQVQLIFIVIPENMAFSPGDDGDEVAFMQPDIFKDSDDNAEQWIYRFWQEIVRTKY